MNQLKIALTVIGLVGIGFISGFFTHRYITQQHLHKISEMRFAKGFKNHLFQVIQADEQQQDTLSPIVEDYAHKIAQIHHQSRMQRKLLVDSLHEKIKPYLNPAQIEELDEFGRRFRAKERMRREKRKKRKGHREKMEE